MKLQLSNRPMSLLLPLTTCGFCTGRGYVLRNAYDPDGRARTEDERQSVCEYCDGSGYCADGDRLLPVVESAPADAEDLH